MEEKKRKVRSDKKHEIKPTVPQNLYDCISRLSYITRTPMKDVAEYLCEAGLNSRDTIEVLKSEFKRPYQFRQTTYMGDPTIERAKAIRIPGPTGRLSLRFQQELDDELESLAYSLGTTQTSAVFILLKVAVQNADLLNQYMVQYVEENLDSSRQEELKEVYAYIRKGNPYFREEELTFAKFINLIYEEVKDQTISMKRSIEKWLDKTVEREKQKPKQTQETTIKPTPKQTEKPKQEPVSVSTTIPKPIQKTKPVEAGIQISVNGRSMKVKTGALSK